MKWLCPLRRVASLLVAIASLTGSSAGLLAAQHGQPSAPTPDALYRSGYDAYGRGDLEAAHASFARLVQVAPQVAVGHAAYGEVLLAQGMATAALQELERARQLNPKAPATEVALGQARLALDQRHQAVEAFRNGLALGAVLSAEESRSFATALALDGLAAEAIGVLEHALQPAPTADDVPAPPTVQESALLEDALGTLLAQGQNLPAAALQFRAALAADPSLASAHAHLGSALLAAQQPEAALPELRRAVELAPAQVLYLIELGRALTGSQQDAEAISVLRGAVLLAEQKSPDPAAPAALYSPAARAGKGSAAAGGAAAAASIEASQQGAAAAEREQARYALALALQAGGQLEEALPLLAAHAAAQPRDEAALTNYALALVQTGDAKHATTLYRQALALGPDTATLREDYGVAYLQESDLDHALEQFRAGLVLEPDNPHLHYDLGLAYKLKDNLAAAIPEFERAEGLEPTLPDPSYTLGVIHMQQGEFAEAATELEKTVALQPANSAAWAVLGSVYKEDGDPAKAAGALRQAISLDPSQPSTRITLAALLAQGGDQAGAAAERRQAADLSRAAVSRQRASFALKSGQALLARGKLKEAEAQLQTAIQAEPRDPAAHLALAEVLARLGREADAALERQQASSPGSASP